VDIYIYCLVAVLSWIRFGLALPATPIIVAFAPPLIKVKYITVE